MPSGRFLREPGVAPHRPWSAVWEGDLRSSATPRVVALSEGATVLSSTPATAAIERWAVGLMELLGAPGAGVAVALENLFPPLASEVVLPLAGFAVHRGVFSLGEAIGWTTAGSVFGALALYGLGAVVGRDRVVGVVSKMPLVDVEDIVRAERWFERRGHLAVLFGRMVPLVRSLVSVPAGVARMPVRTFVVYTAVGSLVWNSLFIGAGYLLGAQWPMIESYAGAYTRLALTFALVVAGSLILRRAFGARGWTARRRGRP